MTEARNAQGLTEEEFLAAYRPGDYPHPSVTVDILVFSLEKKVPHLLLIRRGGHPCLGKWALPGGFVEPEEFTCDAAARELREETHIEGTVLESLGLFSGPHRDPRGWTMSEAFLAVSPESATCVRADDDAAAADWFQVSHRREGQRLVLELKNASEVLTSWVEMKELSGPVGRMTVLGDFKTDKIAFDHCKMIARGILRLEEAGML